MKIIKYVVWEKKLFENYIYFCRETHTTAHHCPLISSMFPRVYHSHTCHFYYSFIYSFMLSYNIYDYVLIIMPHIRDSEMKSS